MAACATINVVIEFLAYRRLRRAPKLAPLITAVGMSFILQQIGLVLNGSTPKQHPSVLPDGGITIGNVQIAWNFLIVLVFTIPILLAMTYLVQRTRQGKAMRATAQDQDAARLMGINVNRTISFTFALGGALAGAAGVMYEQTVGTTSFNLGQQLGLIAFTAAVLGGIGNLTGAVLGGVLIGLIQGLNDGLPLPRSALVADGGVHRPDPADGLQARGHPRQTDDREGVAMATNVSTAPPVTPRQRSAPRLSYNGKWAIGFLIAAVGIFLLYQYLLPNLNDNINSFFDDWLPMSVVDECMVWVICALGLNVVVGYAGLLDLGFVAFWAIGGYVAGWLFSGFVFGVQLELLRLGAAPVAPGIHVNFWFVLIVAGGRLRRRRHPHRCAHPAAQERLPRPGHARVRRDHPAVLPQR